MTSKLKDDALALPLRELGAKLRRKEFSSVDLAELSLSRLEKWGESLGAVCTITRELALQQARAADADLASGKDRGPLHGIPYGIKDLASTKGIPTTWGAQPYRTQVFQEDATVVERLRDAGAVLVAKLSMVELAGGLGYNNADAAWTGPGRTPWNRNFWSGGSSSGPGAAVAAGLVAFAIGSETSGSILTPTAFCGVTGLRPTYGRVSRHGAMALCWTLDKLGPMARGAEDCGLVLEAIAGADPRDPTSLEEHFAQGNSSSNLWKGARPRLAVTKEAADKAQPAVRENFEASLKVLSEYADIVRDVDWPDFPWGSAVSAIVNSEGAAAFVDLIESGRTSELRCPKDRTGGFAALMVPAVDYIQAMRLRAPMRRAVARFYEGFDAVVSPTRQTVSYPIGVDFDKVYPGVGGGPGLIPAGNLCGLPAIGMPNGFGENGLPTSLHFMGPALSEARLIELGVRYQARTDWHRRIPKLSQA